MVKRVVLLGVIFLASCDVPIQTRSRADAKAVVAGYVEDILNQNRWETYDQYFPAQLIFNGTPIGKRELQERVASFRSAYPDFRVTIEEQIAEDDKVVTRLLCRGTHRGTDEGVPATGRAVTFSGIAIDRISGGKVVEMWFLGDVWNRLKQIRPGL